MGDRMRRVDEHDLPGGWSHGANSFVTHFLDFKPKVGCRYGDVWPNSVA